MGKPIGRPIDSSDFGEPPKFNPLSSVNHCQHLLNELLETDPRDFGRKDLALLNLLCAPNLPGSENLDVARCLARLHNLTAFVKSSTERHLHRFPADPDYGNCEPKWRMAQLITVVKRSYGAAYDPQVRDDLERDGHSPFIDSRNAFIHGLLDDDPTRRWGSCSSIPVLVSAIARRLGYPVGLAVNRRHVYARWDNGNSFAFNIEASNPAGMVVHSDEEYRDMYGPLTEREKNSAFFTRALYPAEEFAQFLKFRVYSLVDAGRYGETLLWSARALQFAPDDPAFVGKAFGAADLAMKHRYRQKYPSRPIPPIERNESFSFNVGEFTRVEERSLFLTIAAHYAEATGDLDRARADFVEAARQNYHGNNEQRDLQRFLRKHGMKRKPGPLLPPKNPGQARRFKLSCPIEEEAEQLRGLADEYQRSGELLKARDALHDLYLFDPCDADIFQEARMIERQPRFQMQLSALVEERRRLPLQSGNIENGRDRRSN